MNIAVAITLVFVSRY